MDILQLAISTVPITHNVEYSCVLSNNWSGVSHPVDYQSVSGSAHWSPPVLLAHNKYVDLWSPGEMASPGIENVAETGSRPTLQTEIKVLQNQGLAGDMVVGSDQFNAVDPSQVLQSITLSPSFPYLSSISMMAPSPDWFSGLESFCPRGPGGFWFQSFEIATYPFDAGTEQGTTYTIANEAESPHGPIFQLTRDTVPKNGILLDPTGTTVLPVMTWNCFMTDSEDMSSVFEGDSMMKESGMMEDSEFSMFEGNAMMKESGMMEDKDPNGGFRALRGNAN
jgi:hypothetical protein